MADLNFVFDDEVLVLDASCLKLLGGETKDVESCAGKCGQWICRERWIYNGDQRSAEYGKHCRPPRVVKCQVF